MLLMLQETPLLLLARFEILSQELVTFLYCWYVDAGLQYQAKVLHACVMFWYLADIVFLSLFETLLIVKYSIF